MMEFDRAALEEWQKHQPLAILQLDPSDRIVLRVAGKTPSFFTVQQLCLISGCHRYATSISLTFSMYESCES